jgi:hypothetical protein
VVIAGRRIRLTADVPAELQERVKNAASAAGMTVGAYVTDVLERNVPRLTYTGSGRITAEWIERVDRQREKLAAKYGTFSDSAELIREMRDERTRELMER